MTIYKDTTTNTADENSSHIIAQSKLYTDLNIKPDKKFTLREALTLDNITLTDGKLTSPHQVPAYIIKTLMIANYQAREFEVTDEDKNKYNYDSDSDESEDDDPVGINPMDGVLSVFYRSDLLLRRVLVIKLSACQLSIPFLLPDPAAPSTNVTMLLSALQNVIKSWKSTSNDSKISNEVFATEYPFPIVSFIRIGKNTHSKSSLINKIMSDGIGEHNFFFHKNMKGGDVKRKIADGLVELSWFLPGERENQTLRSEICFANLRGDATQFRKQLDVLSKISSVLCILLPSENPSVTTKAILTETLRIKADIILIFNEKLQQDTQNYFLGLTKKERTGKSFLVTKAKKRNEHRFINDIRQNVQENLHRIKATPLVELASSAHKYGIQLDYYQLPVELENIVDSWLKRRTITDAKNLLRLQMHVPKFADLERQKYCPTRQGTKFKHQGSERSADEIYEDIEQEREAQKKSYQKLDKKILHYLNCVVQMDESERNLALDKIKNQLDKMSQQVLAELHQQYYVASLKLQNQKIEEKANRMSDTQSSEEKHLAELEKSISECSFGLEHIVREFAQLYELPVPNADDYASSAAEMLLSGQPVELMDGDSCYIPLKWFDNVYAKLEQKINNAKIFVISVLGIQSSGKSTLLNTMFGLEFRVSAGRCTRGAFASLIPVCGSLKIESNIDYILVIDTEGLRGSGDPQLREHDNELATFATGVADVTIVNIYGENHNEIKEFLEIAVHAFLKMKLVHKKKACKIVHQNVAATDATEKLSVARVKLKKDLDKMTKVAAHQENCEDKFKKFDDIISFDANEDVFYLPSLLKGCPPMAAVNPEYGRAVREIKENIITLMSSGEFFQLSVSHFRKNVRILWEAMLKENFIFCFRNTIEVRAYTSLDRKYFQVFVNLMVIGMKQLERQIQVALTRCTTRDERKQKWKNDEQKIRQRAEQLKEKMQKEMENFFQTNEDKVILEQWREYIMNKIRQQKDIQVLALMDTCSKTFCYLQHQQDVEEHKQRYKEQLLQKVKTFMTSSAIDTTDQNKCKQAFDQEWEQWIAKVPSCQEIKTNIDNIMQSVLIDTDPILNTEMRQRLGQKNPSIIDFKNINLDVDIDKLHVNIRDHDRMLQREIIFSASIIRDKVIDEADNFVRKTSQSGFKCTRNDLTQLYHKVITAIQKIPENSSFTFSNSLKCDILLYTFANAYEIFDEMEESCIQKRDIRGELERKFRPELESYFLNLCSQMKQEVLAATAIARVLQDPIKSDLNGTMGPAVTGELLTKTIYQSKGSFLVSVLIQLGEEAKFESYVPYLQNPVKFLSEKLNESIENYCLKQDLSSINSILKRAKKTIKEKLSTAISRASERTRDRNEKLTFWIEQFVENCSTLPIKKEMFLIATCYEDLKNIDVLEKTLLVKVGEFVDSLINHGVDEATIKKWNPSPYDCLLTSMFGCQCCCPFCNALCDQTAKDHAGNHSTKIHRPQGLKNYKDEKTKKLIHSICTTDVAGDRRFRNLDTSQQWHPYKDYQSVNDYYKSWTIPPDPSFETSTYWQWFMATFSKELAKHYGWKEPDVPSTWMKHEFKGVRDQLRQEYNI